MDHFHWSDFAAYTKLDRQLNWFQHQYNLNLESPLKIFQHLILNYTNKLLYQKKCDCQFARQEMPKTYLPHIQNLRLRSLTGVGGWGFSSAESGKYLYRGWSCMCSRHPTVGLFFECCHPFGMDLKFIILCDTYFHTKCVMKALYNNRAE